MNVNKVGVSFLCDDEGFFLQRTKLRPLGNKMSLEPYYVHLYPVCTVQFPSQSTQLTDS